MLHESRTTNFSMYWTDPSGLPIIRYELNVRGEAELSN